MEPIHIFVIVSLIVIILTIVITLIVMFALNAKKMEKNLLKDYLKANWDDFVIKTNGKNLPCSFQSQLVTVIDAIVDDVYDKYGMNAMNVIKKPNSKELTALKDIISKEMAMCMNMNSLGEKIRQYIFKLQNTGLVARDNLIGAACIADMMIYRYGYDKAITMTSIDQDIFQNCSTANDAVLTVQAILTSNPTISDKIKGSCSNSATYGAFFQCISQNLLNVMSIDAIKDGAAKNDAGLLKAVDIAIMSCRNACPVV